MSDSSGKGKAAHKRADAMDVYVGGRIKHRRTTLGMSQQTLAKTAGITFQQVQKYENGANRVSASRLAQFSDALDVPVGFFFEGGPGFVTERAGTTGDSSGQLAVQFLSTPDGISLNRAFQRIKKRQVRMGVIALVRTLAEDGDGT